MRKIPLAERFWQKVARGGDDECWYWLAAPGTTGYGSLRDEAGTRRSAHRLAWMLTHGEVPDGLFVLHRCDNRGCCNPSHLFLGTQLDNVRDMQQKGRRRQAVGQDTHRAKLTPEQVNEIRRRHRRVRSGQGVRLDGTTYLAREFGVSVGTIMAIMRGQYWGWLGED